MAAPVPSPAATSAASPGPPSGSLAAARRARFTATFAAAVPIDFFAIMDYDKTSFTTMPAILDPQTEKRTKIRQWEATAIGLQEAEARQLIRYSSITHWRNWTCREALYDFAQQSAHPRPH